MSLLEIGHIRNEERMKRGDGRMTDAIWVSSEKISEAEEASFPRPFSTLHTLGPFLGSQGHINRAASHIFTTYEVRGFLQMESLVINCPP